MSGILSAISSAVVLVTGDNPVVLGPVLFSGFEVPERIEFGGHQQMTVHKLPGGERVIDVMGQDDRPISWSGTFLGPDAAERARLLDSVRQAGSPVSLLWGGFFFTVVVASVGLDYRFHAHIPYRIECTVLADNSQAYGTAAPTVGEQVLDDLNAAATAVADITARATDVAAAITAVTTAPELQLGSAAYLTALGAVNTAAAGISGALVAIAAPTIPITAPDTDTFSGAFSGALAGAQNLAELATGRGYAGRAAVNTAEGAT